MAARSFTSSSTVPKSTPSTWRKSTMTNQSLPAAGVMAIVCSVLGSPVAAAAAASRALSSFATACESCGADPKKR